MFRKVYVLLGMLVMFLLSTGFTNKEKIESVMYAKEPVAVYDGTGSDAGVLGMFSAFEEVAVIKHNGKGVSAVYFQGTKGYVAGNVLTDYVTIVPMAVEAGYTKLMLPMLYVRPEENSKTIFVGDSRTGQMFHCVRERGNNDTWIAQSGEGYKWFSKIATPLLEGVAEPGDKIVIQMGINDLFGMDTVDAAIQYMMFANTELMDWIANGAEVYVVSINPVEKHGSITNEQIEYFNLMMSTCLAEEVHYIDSYSALKTGKYPTVDGIHYSNEVYEKIYQYIKNQIEPEKALPIDFNDYPAYLFPAPPVEEASQSRE